MLEQFRSDARNDSYRRAAEARRTAESASDLPATSKYLHFERRWLASFGGFEAECKAETGQRTA
jgi:hypothetical protein